LGAACSASFQPEAGAGSTNQKVMLPHMRGRFRQVLQVCLACGACPLPPYSAGQGPVAAAGQKRILIPASFRVTAFPFVGARP
jgi:hypothetical protein